MEASMQSGLQAWGCCTALLAAQFATAPTHQACTQYIQVHSIVMPCQHSECADAAEDVRDAARLWMSLLPELNSHQLLTGPWGQHGTGRWKVMKLAADHSFAGSCRQLPGLGAWVATASM